MYFNESSANISLTAIFKFCNIHVEPTYLSLEDSIEKVKTGEIAGAGFMGGAPVAAFNKQIAPGDKVHFLSFDTQTVPGDLLDKLLQAYLPATLTNEAYPKIIPQGQKVVTLASGVVLAAYNWPESSDRYRRVA